MHEADRKPLLLRGARQVGKSWIVAQWAKEVSLDLIVMNFEEQPQFIQVFEADFNIDRIIDEIATLTGKSLRKPDSIVFLI